MVWKIFSALSLVLAAVAALVSATTAPEYKTCLLYTSDAADD